MKRKINSPNKYKLFRSRNLKVFRKSFARAYYNEVFFPEIRIAGNGFRIVVLKQGTG
jgi:toxic protein SymE